MAVYRHFTGKHRKWWAAAHRYCQNGYTHCLLYAASVQQKSQLKASQHTIKPPGLPSKRMKERHGSMKNHPNTSRRHCSGFSPLEFSWTGIRMSAHSSIVTTSTVVRRPTNYLPRSSEIFLVDDIVSFSATSTINSGEPRRTYHKSVRQRRQHRHEAGLVDQQPIHWECNLHHRSNSCHWDGQHFGSPHPRTRPSLSPERNL